MTIEARTAQNADAPQKLSRYVEDAPPRLHDIGFLLRLPERGPLMGWTRKENGRLTARVWIKPDETDSDIPIAVLTVRCDDGRPQPGTAELWQMFRLDPTLQGAEVGHFGFADLAFEEEEARYWVLGLHRVWIGGETGGADVSGDQRGRAVHHAVRDSSKMPRWAIEAATMSLNPLPVPLVPHSWNVGDPADSLDTWVAEAIKYLDQHLAGQDRRAMNPRRTLSREKLKTGSLADCEVRLATGPRACMAGSDALRFAAVSCRYPSLSIDRKFAERPLRALAALADRAEGPGFVLMTGDQIYADVWAGLLDVRDRLEKYTARYRDAFSTSAFRALASRIPLYMTADDHEIEDGWPKSREKPGVTLSLEALRAQPLFEWARRTFLAHQRMHGPMAPDGENVASAEPCFWYDFVAGDGPVAVPVLVLDTRFRRGLEPGGAGRILNEEQWKRIQDWLGERPNGLDRYAPRFIVSGSVFAPGRLRFARDPASARRADSWQGYPEARARLAQLIAQAGVENVVFVSGDYHCAAVADLAIARPGGADIRAYAIVSPPLYAPFPFVNTRVHEIAAVEAIAFPPDHADGEKPIATCRAGALEINSGFALITCQKVAANGDADDWEVGVEFHAAAWDGSGKPTSKIVGTARLARGEATLLPPT